jgi:hypothetical protein
MSSQYKLKQEKGVLHVGGGRFFYPGETYGLTDEEAATYGHYFSEEQVAVVEEDEEQGEKDLDNDKIEDIVIIEKATDNTENKAETVEAEVKVEFQVEPKVETVQKSRKSSSEKAEK